jgi:glycosyltransferase involved in cell wall biosynthesis
VRIALFAETFLPHTDGIVTRLVYTIEELRRAGDDVLVVAPAARGLPESFHGARVLGAYSVTLPLYPDMRLGLPVPGRPVARAIRSFAPDVMHAVNPFALGLGALYFARRLQVPLLASYHTHVAVYATRYHLSLLEGTAWAYLRSIHNQARLNLCTSRPVRDELAARGFQRLELWDPGVDAERFHPSRAAAEWRARLTGGNPDATILLSVGRLAVEKQLDTLAPVLAHLPGAHLSFVGSGPAEDHLRSVFAGMPATFVGPLHGADLAAAYASADIFVLPSPTETLGLVALEAMAAGLPVLGARRGGIPDLVAEGDTGLLFDPDAPGDLTRHLRTLAENVSLRQRMGNQGRRRAEGWSWARTTAGLRARYAGLLPAR